MITSNYRLTRVQIYKAIKVYKGDNLMDDLTLALYERNLSALSGDGAVLTSIDHINSISGTHWGKKIIDGYRQEAINHLRCFKTMKLKNNCKNK